MRTPARAVDLRPASMEAGPALPAFTLCIDQHPRLSQPVAALAPAFHESRDPGDRTEPVELEVVGADPDSECFLEMHEEIDEGQRVEDAALEQIGLRVRYGPVQLVREDGRDGSLECVPRNHEEPRGSR